MFVFYVIEPEKTICLPAGKRNVYNCNAEHGIDVVGGTNSTLLFTLGPLSSAIAYSEKEMVLFSKDRLNKTTIMTYEIKQ